MKYLLVFAVLFIALWLFRKGQRKEEQRRAKPPTARPAVGQPQAMVRCAHCGLHLPAADAIDGRSKGGAVYCSIAHRQAAEP